jgi:Domain of unknown function (DUF4150)
MDVYANGMSIACKAADGKTVAAFPDVCFTPPLTPATPPGVPIPYPNTAMASDTTNGTKTVMIAGQEVMLKNISVFKTSTGDEAGSAPKKGVVTSTIKGEANFISWSMDVKFEGENIPRHLDLMGHNEQCDPTNTPPWVYLEKMEAPPEGHPCHDEIVRAQGACKDSKPMPVGDRIHLKCDSEGKCEEKMACILVPKGQDKEKCCSPNNTGHHMIEDHWVSGVEGFPMAQNNAGYEAALTVCANPVRTPGTRHRMLHDIQGTFEESFMKGGARYDPSLPNGGWNYGAGKEAALTAHNDVLKSSGCSRRCLENQLDDFYGTDQSRPLKEPTTQGIGEARTSMAAQYNPPMAVTPE